MLWLASLAYSRAFNSELQWSAAGTFGVDPRLDILWASGLAGELKKAGVSMQFVNLGRSGLKVSRICLGCMGFGGTTGRIAGLTEDEARPLVVRALKVGINYFDTADVYSRGMSEEILGKGPFQGIRVARDRVVIATKVFNPTGDGVNQRGLSRKHIRHAIDDSLRRLSTDYVDLYQIHRFDPDTPVEETLEALTSVVKAGKALYIGASSMYSWQFAKMLHASDRFGLSRFVSMQNSYNLVYREEEREMISSLPSGGNRAGAVGSAGTRLSGRESGQCGIDRGQVPRILPAIRYQCV